MKVPYVRLGIYGEPTFLTLKQIRDLTTGRNWTGYSHQWMHNKEYRTYLMASVYTYLETVIAKSEGWRVYLSGESLSGVNCPASKEAGRKTTCNQCLLCAGTSGKSTKDIWIKQH